MESSELLSGLMFVSFFAALIGVTVAFCGLAMVALMGMSNAGVISSSVLVRWMKGRISDSMRLYWMGIGVAAGLIFGGLGWWMLTIVAGTEISTGRAIGAALGGSVVGCAIAFGSFEAGKRLLGKFQIPKA